MWFIVLPEGVEIRDKRPQTVVRLRFFRSCVCVCVVGVFDGRYSSKKAIKRPDWVI